MTSPPTTLPVTERVAALSRGLKARAEDLRLTTALLIELRDLYDGGSHPSFARALEKGEAHVVAGLIASIHNAHRPLFPDDRDFALGHTQHTLALLPRTDEDLGISLWRLLAPDDDLAAFRPASLELLACAHEALPAPASLEGWAAWLLVAVASMLDLLPPWQATCAFIDVRMRRYEEVSTLEALVRSTLATFERSPLDSAREVVALLDRRFAYPHRWRQVRHWLEQTPQLRSGIREVLRQDGIEVDRIAEHLDDLSRLEMLATCVDLEVDVLAPSVATWAETHFDSINEALAFNKARLDLPQRYAHLLGESLTERFEHYWYEVTTPVAERVHTPLGQREAGAPWPTFRIDETETYKSCLYEPEWNRYDVLEKRVDEAWTSVLRHSTWSADLDAEGRSHRHHSAPLSEAIFVDQEDALWLQNTDASRMWTSQDLGQSWRELREWATPAFRARFAVERLPRLRRIDLARVAGPTEGFAEVERG